jgi:outer membrane beta-barrel protein
MKKNIVIIVIMMLMAVVTTVQAEVREGSFSVTPFIGGYVFEGNENLKDAATVGLRVGYNFTENVGVEGFFSYLQTEIQDESQWKPWQDVYSYGIEGLYHFMPKGRFVPFIAIGLGGIYYSDGYNYKDSSYGKRFESNKFAVDYGAGVKFFLTDDIALRADIRHILLPTNGGYNDLLVTFGINFSFGGEKKEVAETMVEEPAAPKEAVAAAKAEEPPAPKEAVAAAKVEEPATPQETVVAAPAPVAAPAVNESLAPVSNEQKKTKPIPEENVRDLVNRWLTSWQSGNMKTYRSCYASNFQSKEMNLNTWISYKTNVRQNSKNISIHIENLKISANANTSKAVFTQYYNSSIFNSKIKKKLELRKISNKWKIYRETIVHLENKETFF